MTDKLPPMPNYWHPMKVRWGTVVDPADPPVVQLCLTREIAEAAATEDEPAVFQIEFEYYRERWTSPWIPAALLDKQPAASHLDL